jgi:hypothetical protein
VDAIPDDIRHSLNLMLYSGFYLYARWRSVLYDNIASRDLCDTLSQN